jgi:hypothetical protein
MPDEPSFEGRAELELIGIFLQSFGNACVNLKLLLGDHASMLLGAEAERWYPVTVFFDAVKRIEDRFPNPEPIKERLGIEMMHLWYERGPGRSVVTPSTRARGGPRFAAPRPSIEPSSVACSSAACGTRAISNTST